MDQPEANPHFNPQKSPETLPTPAVPSEGTPQAAPERPSRGAEQLPNPNQAIGGQGAQLPPVQLPVVPDEPPVPASASLTSTTTVDTPLIADDVDVIEMEWVNKAKQVIKAHKDDPHAQEEAVEQLQIDYLKKRYGKEIQKRRGE